MINGLLDRGIGNLKMVDGNPTSLWIFQRQRKVDNRSIQTINISYSAKAVFLISRDKISYPCR